MLRPRPLSTLRIIRVDTRSFEVKAPPPLEFFRYCEALFFSA